MSSSEAPPPPDYTPIAEASKEASAEATALAREQFDWAKQAYADNKGVTDKVVDSFLQSMDTNQANADKDRARYEQIYQPLEDDLAKEAKDYATPERKDLEMGRAQSTVGQQFQAARANAQRDLEAFGVDPSSTRFAALDIGARAQEAAAKAGAGNQASQMVDATGRALRSEAINVGRGYPGQIAGTYNTSLQAGTGAVNSGNSTTATGGQTMGTAPQYMGQSNAALNTWGNTLNMGYQNQLGQFNADQNASSGWGSALGIGASLLTTPLKGTALAALASGGAVGEATPGGTVPAAASPTGGKAVDDVPSALTVGEFVVPKDTVQWLGEKHMYGLIEKSRADREEAKQRTGAVPVMRPAAVQRPTFQSRPSAIPMQRAA